MFIYLQNFRPDKQPARLQKMTKKYNLTITQERAIQLLMTGLTDQQVADNLETARPTITNWRNHDSAFVARFNAERKAVWSAHQEKLRAMVSKAVNVLGSGLDSQDEKIRQNSAIHVLKSVGVYGNQLINRWLRPFSYK